ncbi:MAG: anthranilate synthase component I family protein [bacterium]|nr:anthranilate synthase component I family protein [bacterium]
MRREDKITPSSAYISIRSENSFLLESVKGKENIARHSFIGFDPFLVVKAKEDRMIVCSEKGEITLRGNPFHLLKGILKEAKAHPHFNGGFGYFGYELAWFIEDLPKKKKDGLDLPDLYLIFPKSLIVFDHKLQSLNILSPKKEEVEKKISDIRHQTSDIRDQTSDLRPQIDSNFTKEGYIKMVERAKKYIKAGDIYQANLSQRLSARIEIDPWILYQRLIAINPSPFSAYFELDGFSIASSSPERLVRVKDGLIETRPIAGTRPRSKIKAEDEKLASELILSQKERAEHIMLVDLERNDLGRVCRYGTVKVDELMAIERYSHVMHIVSNISGELKSGIDFIDCILATFPGGTITGVPKVRCMEIINELEPTKRGPYTGSIGYIGFDGTMDLNIIIRTFVIKDGVAYIQAGGGIVADSEPILEYYETLHKAEALVQSF